MCLVNNEVCNLTLLATKSNNENNIIGINTIRDHVHAAAGLNWGYSSGMPAIGDAYISISTSNIRQCSDLFIKNHPIYVIWDDGTKMTMLAEQNSQGIGDGVLYGKALSSYRDKSILGNYLRKRIGEKIGKNLIYSDYAKNTLKNLKLTNKGDKEAIKDEIRNTPLLLQELNDKFITLNDLQQYGRTNISVRILENGIYYFDFHVSENNL